MRRKGLVILIAVTTAFLFVACTDTPHVADDIKKTVARAIQGEIEIETGETRSALWFDFTVGHIKRVDQYAGHLPAGSHMLIDVFITQTGTFDDTEPIPMGTFDFYMDSSIFEEHIYPLDPFDDTMMPREFDLAFGETVSHRMVYEIPDNVPDLKLMYTEWDENDRQRATFSIYINLDEL